MHERDRRFLEHAARLALRGHGGAEPNPLVGCVIASPDGQVVGWGYHRHCGGPHAEVIALQRAGSQARHGTMYVTLEPCAHVGRTGPCAGAIVTAGIRRVVIARRDPNPVAAGGVARLRASGVIVELIDGCHAALALTDPFVHRVHADLPWVVAKWAQTLDGRMAIRAGASGWISSPVSRAMVHRERGRVDAILTGIGTILADDPLLTARQVRRRRTARRVIVDRQLRIPLHARIIQTADEAPITIASSRVAMERHADKVRTLHRAGIDIVELPAPDDQSGLKSLLSDLAKRFETATVLVEAGPALLGSLFRRRLVNEAWVFIAPRLEADDQALPAAGGLIAPALADETTLQLIDHRRRGEDIMLRYRVTYDPSAPVIHHSA